MSDKAESSPQRQVNRVVLLEYPLWELRDLGELEELKDVVPGRHLTRFSVSLFLPLAETNVVTGQKDKQNANNGKVGCVTRNPRITVRRPHCTTENRELVQ